MRNYLAAGGWWSQCSCQIQQKCLVNKSPIMILSYFNFRDGHGWPFWLSTKNPKEGILGE